MRKIMSFVVSLVFLLSLMSFSGCSPKEEESPVETPSDPNVSSIYEDYTAEDMKNEVYSVTGVDIGDIVSEYDVENMSSAEKEELLIYLMNYAHYKDLSNEAFLSDFSSLSPETFNLLKEEIENCDFENLSADEKMKRGQEFYEVYSFYDYTEEDAVSVTESVYGVEEDDAREILSENGYFSAEGNKEKSRVLYGMFVEGFE